MRVGLVLGAGGVQGGAWLTGGLDALASTTGWDPATADVVVGTSAGSVIGSLVRRRHPALVHGRPLRRRDLRGRHRRPRPPGRRGRPLRRRALPPRQGLAADRPRLVAARAAHAARAAPLPARPRSFAGWAPRGFISTEPLKEIIRTRRPARAGAGTRTTGSSPATTPPAAASPSAATARRKADLADAVAASCAIPGFYHPVEIAGRRYVDGGIYSTSNLDLVRDEHARPRHLPQPDLLPAPDARLEPGRAGRAS